MRDFRDRSKSSWMVRASANLFAVFGGLAVFLSVVGVYAVRAYLVSRRRREIGIRMALGATSRDVMRLVLGEGVVLVAVGLGAGFLLAALAGMAVSSLVYQVGAFDPLVFTTAPFLLAIAALVARHRRRARDNVARSPLRSKKPSPARSVAADSGGAGAIEGWQPTDSGSGRTSRRTREDPKPWADDGFATGPLSRLSAASQPTANV
jgi:predicted lysophospholipase L1 biosynthesis ABC-type transport system permease subunit